ncbi:MAG: L,D-transpeptidase [Syntrophales bacterium]|nr:L,D-transpeptidase [Syntrophales bacterium]MDD5640515.1 L,D-transpeptidase [Syntrophales bacterium]
MPRLGFVFCLCFLGCLAATAAVAGEIPLYHQVAGCQEEYAVEGRRVSLVRLAQERGIKWTALGRHNRLKPPYRLKKGMVLKINTTHIVPDELTDGLIINLPELVLYYFKDGIYQRRYTLAVGKPSWPTPTGIYKIIDKRKNPTWNVPESIQEEMWEGGLEVLEQVPPGPKNPLGKFFMLTSAEGVGIHATNRPSSVGYYASHGCIRMLPNEIAKLFPQVALGTPVKIIYRPVKMALTPQGRIFLEAHPNVYRKEMDYMDVVMDLAEKNHLVGRINWKLVPKILKAKEGIAQDITRELPADKPATAAAPAPAPRHQESSLFPLQRKEAKLE